MAKLRAPLLSLGASGALGKAIVFFPWKGLDCVREYVVPANPKSDLQVSQRNKMKAGVLSWHSTNLVAADRAAWKLRASTLAKPLTAMNMFVKRVIEVMILKRTWLDLYELTATRTADDTATVTAKADEEIATGFCRYGETKAATYIVKSAEYADTTWTASLTGLVKGKKYFAFMGQGSGTQSGETGIIEIPAEA